MINRSMFLAAVRYKNYFMKIILFVSGETVMLTFIAFYIITLKSKFL